VTLIALLALAAALRFSTLDLQSVSPDDAFTVLAAKGDFGSLMHIVIQTKGSPPLYYWLVWLWGKIFGTSEVGLRSLSALAGTGTVVVAYRIGRSVISRRAGLIAAALAAVNPMLVWYSQVEREYALLVLLSALSLLFFLRTLDVHGVREIAWWAAFSGLALATHYYAALLVVPETGWLLISSRRGREGRAVMALAAVGLALLPLLIYQQHHLTALGYLASGGSSLLYRLVAVPKQFLVSAYIPYQGLAVAIAAAVTAYAGWLLFKRTDDRERQVGFRCGALAASGFAAGVVGAIAGFDYLSPYRMLAIWMPFAVVLSSGLGARRAGRGGLIATAGLCALGVWLVAGVDSDPIHQRVNWRGAAHALGPDDHPRAIVASPGDGGAQVRVYRSTARLMSSRGMRVTEVAVVGLPREIGRARPRWRPTPRAPVPGLSEVSRDDSPTFTVLRYRGALAVRITPRMLLAWSGSFIYESGSIGQVGTPDVLIEPSVPR
jgi:4-amino-4-deoxy-L-arabinose transferase-like glycosyltransferase